MNAPVYDDKAQSELFRIGRQTVLIRLHNRRRASRNRAILKAVDTHRFTNDPMDLINAINAVDYAHEDPITDEDVATYLRNK